MCSDFGETEERRDCKWQNCLEGFYFGKAVQKKIQENVAVRREKQILSIKKKFNQLAQKRGEGQG